MKNLHHGLKPQLGYLCQPRKRSFFEDEESTQASDAHCVSIAFRFAGAPDAIVAVTEFVPEVNWTSNVRKVTLLEVYNRLCRSFEFLNDGGVFVRPGMRDQTYRILGHFSTSAYSVFVWVLRMTPIIIT